MKKIIILVSSILLATVIYFVANSFVTDYITASGPNENDRPLIMVDSKLYESKSSCSESAFSFIKESEGFALSEVKIIKAVKSEITPVEDLTTNYSIFKEQEIYLSTNKPESIYIKTTVNNEIRYYLFTPASGATNV